MSESVCQHRREAPMTLRCAVITVSDTRTPETDTGGKAVADYLTAAGYNVVSKEIIPDEPDRMRPLVGSFAEREDIDVVLLTGGTG
ncbi:MAG: MogA/MoaB family molybdenum cofactor biosynthesis protein, partial [Terriglobales bacterium]